MEQNKVRTYLLYAVGEIALVMIGILLALQVNNWNESRINYEKESRYLTSMTRDLEAQIQFLDLKIEREELARGHMESLMNEYRTTNRIMFTEKNGTKFFALSDRATYVINKPTFTELLSTGNLELIRDEVLRNSIVEYYQRMDLTELVILKNNDLKDNLIQSSAIGLIDFPTGQVLYTPSDNGMNSSSAITEDVFISPSMSEAAQRINEDESKLLELMNILKIRWLIAQASIDFLIEDRTRTVELIRLINRTKN